MRDHLPSLLLRQPVIHRPVQVICDLCHLAGSNQRADGNETPISRSKVRTQSQVEEQNVSGVCTIPGDVAELLFRIRCTFRLPLLVERKKRRLSGRKLIRSDLTIGKNIFRHYPRVQ